jgi:predicted phage replisome organizer
MAFSWRIPPYMSYALEKGHGQVSDNKRYYYIKLKDNYFEKDNVKVLEAMKNGHTYSLILIKMYLKASKYDGRLMMTPTIPYDPDKVDILANVLNHDVDHVKEAIRAGVQLDLISIIDGHEIWMTEIQNMIGQSSTEADRVRDYRKRIDGQKALPDVQMYDKCTPELEREREQERETKIEEPVFSKAEALNPNKKNSEQRFQQLKTAWNANCKPSCAIRGTDTMNYYQREDWLAGESQIVDIFATCKAMQNYGGILGNPEYEIDGHKGYSLLSFLIKGVEWYTDEAKPFERCKKKQAKVPERPSSVEVPGSAETAKSIDELRATEKGAFEFRAAEAMEKIRARGS